MLVAPRLARRDLSHRDRPSPPLRSGYFRNRAAFAIAAAPGTIAQGVRDVPWWHELQGPDGPTQDRVSGRTARYFQPLDLRVNRAGNGGLASGASSGSPDARLISRSRSSSLGRPTSWSTNIRECCDGISNFLPQVLQATSSSRRSR